MQRMSDRHLNIIRHFNNGYIVFDKKMFIVRDDQAEFFQQFKNIPFRTFFSENHLKEYDNGGEYFNSNTVVETEATINIHTEFSMVLFFYLLNEMKDEIEQFLNILESNAFEAKFSGMFKVDQYTLKYDLSIHKHVYPFLMANVPNFGIIYHLFHRTHSDMMYVDEHYMVVRVNAIKNLLNENLKIYDFQNYRII